jgi:hypothetical protein
VFRFGFPLTQKPNRQADLTAAKHPIPAKHRQRDKSNFRNEKRIAHITGCGNSHRRQRVAARRGFMKTTVIRILSCAWLASASIAPAFAQDYFQIMLSGAYETPPNSSRHGGGGTATAAGSVLCYDIFVPGMQPTSAAIFGPAPAGVVGPFIAALTNDSPEGSPPDMTEYSFCIGLTDEQVEQLNAGLLYVEVASSDYPLGELRGQICPMTAEGDCDGDGVPNGRDGCAATWPGWPVDWMGCTILDKMVCSGFKNHKDYVKAMREAAKQLWKQGILTAEERNDLIKEAEASDCGNPPRPLSP